MQCVASPTGLPWTAIRFIDKPEFRVDFRRYSKNKLKPSTSAIKTLHKVKIAAGNAFVVIICFAQCLAKAIQITLSGMGDSFRYNVLGFYGRKRINEYTTPNIFLKPSGVAQVAVRIVFWVIQMSWCVVSTTMRLFLEETLSKEGFPLAGFVSDDINVAHIRTKRLALDTSKLPEGLKIDMLDAFLDAINFEDSSSPEYMQLKDGETKETLKASLQRFIEYVKTRKADIGTPPSYDIDRLFNFYLHIESSVRLCIFNVMTALEEFQKKKGTDPNTYNEEDRKTYRDLLEERSRLTIDLARAGAYCCARFSSEALDAYQRICCSELGDEGTLEDHLIEILAKKRKTIARSHIDLHFRSEEDQEESAHWFGRYMEAMGKLLAIPGTGNVDEHLAPEIDRNKFLKLFFEDYTVDAIIEAVQEEVKSKDSFRQKIYAWCGDQRKNWKKDEYSAMVPQRIEAIQRVLEEKEEDAKLDGLRLKLSEADISPEMAKGFADIIAEKLKSNKTGKIRNVLNLSDDTIAKIIERGKALPEEVLDALELERRQEFNEALGLLEIKDGLTDKQMEWLLVSHNILRPQTDLYEGPIDSPVDAVADPAVENYYKRVVYNVVRTSSGNDEEFARKVSESSPSLLSPDNADQANKLFLRLSSGTHATSSKRYQFEAPPAVACKRLAQRIFDLSFKFDPDQQIDDAEDSSSAADSPAKPFYPSWRKTCLIKIPTGINALLQNNGVRVVITAASIAAIFSIIFTVHQSCSRVMTSIVTPFVVSHIPIRIMRINNLLMRVGNWAVNNPLKFLGGLWLAKGAIKECSVHLPPEVTVFAKKISKMFDNPWEILSILTLKEDVLELGMIKFVDAYYSLEEGLKVMKNVVTRIAQNENNRRLRICKEKARQVWFSQVHSIAHNRGESL